MKKLFLSLIYLLVIGISANAQNSYSAKTGDSELDTLLKDINVNAHADLALFKKDLSVDFLIAEDKLNNLMVSFGMQPADIYIALELSRLTTNTIDQVCQSYKTNKGKGWGVVAMQLGVKPGSNEFHALKNNAKVKQNKMKDKKHDEKHEVHGHGCGHDHGKK